MGIATCILADLESRFSGAKAASMSPVLAFPGHIREQNPAGAVSEDTSNKSFSRWRFHSFLVITFLSYSILF
jgi:hypothetical protein